MAARALDEGEMELEPMNAFERKIVHDAVGEITGVTSFSEGEEPHRRVVIAPDD
jgi:spoIIIJ-associated protein